MLTNDHDFVGQAFSASLSLMSILIAVITILIVEYERVKTDIVLAEPLFYMVVGTTAATILSGLTALLSLFYYRGFRNVTHAIYWSVVILVILLLAGVPLIVWKLV
jgi:hypothetical protein